MPSRFFLPLLILTAPLGAEALDLLILEVSDKFLKPTCERALGPDRDALDEAIVKLRKLAPDRGVRELLDLTVERTGQGPEILPPVLPVPGGGVRATAGCGDHFTIRTFDSSSPRCPWNSHAQVSS